MTNDILTMTNEELEFHIYKSLKEGQDILARSLLKDIKEDNMTLDNVISYLNDVLSTNNLLLPESEIERRALIDIDDDSTQH